MEDIKRTVRVFVEVAFMAGCGVGLVMIPAGISDFLLDTQFSDFLFKTYLGVLTLVAAGLLVVSFFIQEGQFSRYKQRYERHEEKGG